MSVEISEVKWGGYYRDNRCKELEIILHDNPNYREYIIERQHYHEDIGYDPFVVKDEDGKDIITLEKWEIDTLNRTEFLSYIDVQQRRNQCFDLLESVAFYLLFMSVLLGGAVSLFAVQRLIQSYPPLPYSYLIISVSYMLMIISGFVYYLRHKIMVSRKREVDLEVARSNPAFLKALQKLAAVPKAEYVYNDEHIKKLKYIETAIAGVSS